MDGSLVLGSGGGGFGWRSWLLRLESHVQTSAVRVLLDLIDGQLLQIFELGLSVENMADVLILLRDHIEFLDDLRLLEHTSLF